MENNTEELKCYCLDGQDWVAAKSPEEALSLWESTTGLSWEKEVGEPFKGCWAIWAGARPLTIHDDEGEMRTQTVQQWIDELGPGIICSANW
jgi:hypothetical protein